MKRIAGILLAVAIPLSMVVADFAADGGWLLLFDKSPRLVSPQDEVTRTDTVTINNVHVDTLELAAPIDTTTPMPQFAVLTFIVGDNTDTVRHVFAVAPTGDTLFLLTALEDSTAANDSAVVEWYTDETALDTAWAGIEKRMPTCASYSLIARLNSINHSDSCGVIVVFRNRTEDGGTWATIFTAYLDSAAMADTFTSFGDSATAWLIGDQWQTIVILADSVGGVTGRQLVTDIDALIRCKKY